MLSRTIGLGFLGLCLLSLALKLLVPIPGPLGYAPVDLGIGPEVPPVELVVWYTTEKEAWLEQAAERFRAQAPTVDGRPVQLSLVGLGSGELLQRVVAQEWRGASPPAALSPASSLWVEQLEAQWAARNGGDIVAGNTPPLALTPLVVVAWQERADLIWSGDPAAFWDELAAAVADEGGWASVAARRGFGPESPTGARAAAWGLVKLGHSSPLSSNSGAQTLLLLAYAYHQKSGGLSAADIADPGFRDWLASIERAALDLNQSTSAFMTNMVRFGPSRYDVVVTYESLAIANLEAAERQWGPARVYYPPATILSDHPFVTLGDPLTTPEQREAAARFRDFLLSPPIQELALQNGFRPATTAVSIGAGDSSPFGRYAAYGVRPQIDRQVEAPSPEVLAALADLWAREIAPLTVRP
jgi:hypothetical protein